ncbi:MAG: acetyl-CoA carboxylase biotin carboxylase subunit [Salibacteraceae bacterium]|jgi:acetyl-CoA carboxylase biotin carboxylase subunit
MKKILVANRGEIALRIMRTCKDMGISTVAIYSEADADSLFVKFADEAVCVGPPPSAESYLRGDYIIEKAVALGVEGIHPGYGFLSENGEFAQKVTDAGIKFIGPLPKSMAMMGDKLAAKAAVKNYNIPMVPGTEEAISDPSAVVEIAKEIGFPILIKAAAGGGGKGMRIVEKEEELEEQIQLATNEAKSAFGDGSVFIEKYVGSPRHIEIQVLADEHGNVVHLFERDCSIQRRHQKVIEEAPSAILTPELRKEMGECACEVARACDYWGAGTVEFLYESGKYYFLEMNTRLQVEHPVSELIANLDLVEQQIKVARGEKLAFTQEDLKIHGHSIEVRVYAEDPENNFLPDIGRLSTYRLPVGEGIRVDDSMEEGKAIPIYYDPMISKLIVWAPTREEAIEKMIGAIDDYQINGVETTLSFCRYAINHDAFRSGNFDTHFVNKHFDPKNFRYVKPEEEELAALIGAHLTATAKGRLLVGAKEDQPTAWKLNRQ